MLGTFLEKVGGLFDRRFIVAYWSPLFIGFGLAGGLVVVTHGLPVVFDWWVKLSVEEHVVLGVGSLLAVTILAYVLDALTVPLVRFYEGYWPWKWLTRLTTLWQKTRKARRAASAKPYEVPRNPALLRPTGIGNVLAAAEEYPYQLYRQDAVIWWPRLVTLLPESFRSQLDTALTPLLALLNLSMILTLLAVGGGVSLLLTDRHWWWVSVFIGGLVLARACYIAAVNQAVDYGQFVRVAFDLYRHDILKQIHVPVPDNLVEERLLWDALNAMVNSYILPWETEVATQTPRLAHPFYYDTHPTSTTSTEQQEIAPTNTARGET